MKKLNSRTLSDVFLIYIYLFIAINSFPLGGASSFILFVFGGGFGLILLAFSTKFIKNNNISYSVKYGFAGSILVITNIVFLFVAYRIFLHPIIIFDILSVPIFCLFYIILIDIRRNHDLLKDETLIRQTVLDFGTRLTRLKVAEIAERTGAFHKTIIDVVEKMIQNNEIYARYFKSSNSVVFNQDANIDEIDRLMSVYNEWEKEVKGKISK
ncbi:MAG: hypothetical protein ACFFA8_09195 [Promethearchaeota archaeon]